MIKADEVSVHFVEAGRGLVNVAMSCWRAWSSVVCLLIGRLIAGQTRGAIRMMDVIVYVEVPVRYAFARKSDLSITCRSGSGVARWRKQNLDLITMLPRRALQSPTRMLIYLDALRLRAPATWLRTL